MLDCGGQKGVFLELLYEWTSLLCIKYTPFWPIGKFGGNMYLSTDEAQIFG